MTDYTKIYIETETGERISLAEAKKRIMHDIQVQTAKFLTNVDKTGRNPGMASEGMKPAPEFVADYQKARDLIFDDIMERMATAMTAELLDELIDTAGVTMKRFDSVMGDSLAASFAGNPGSYFGMFIEKRFLGLFPNASKSADIPPVAEFFKGTEVKGHTSVGSERKIGKITTKNISENEALNNWEVRNILKLYKTAEKMSNFLMFKGTLSKRDNGNSLHASIYEIMLNIEIILKKLYDFIYHKIHKDKEIIKITTADDGAWDAETMSKTWEVTLNIEKVNLEYQYIRMYLYHYDLLKDIKTDRTTQNNVWGVLRHMQLMKLGKAEDIHIRLE